MFKRHSVLYTSHPTRIVAVMRLRSSGMPPGASRRCLLVELLDWIPLHVELERRTLWSSG